MAAVSTLERAYRTLSGVARRAAPLLARGDSKLARAVRARRGAADQLIEWARRGRDPDRPLLWAHAPSVGEGLQARAVIEALRARAPEVQVVFTHFSPSAERLAARMPADFAGTLPWDVPDEAGRAVAALRPDLLCFTKTELWPVLARAAHERGAATALMAATLPDGSSRARWPARAVLRPTLTALDLVAAVGEPDAERLVALGASAGAVRVTGDPGIDAAAERVLATDQEAPHLRPFRSAIRGSGHGSGRGSGRPTLVAGSTWPADEAVLVPACVELRRAHPLLRVILAPHEPEERGMRALEARLRAEGWRTARLAEIERGGAGDADLVVVDRVGILAELYTVGELAWVGGGFHAAGLHSVLEPAAAGLPLVFGPRHRNARAAGELLRRGAARVVENAAGAAAVLGAWLADGATSASAGSAALHYIQSHRGAAARTAALLAQRIDDPVAR